jgi:hypothetical protein
LWASASDTAGNLATVGPFEVELSRDLLLPGVPSLLGPPDGNVTSTQAITFEWQAGPGGMPEGYNLALDGSIVTTTVGLSPTILAIGVHTWTVRAYNTAGYSAWSTPWTVEVVATLPPPGIPRLLSPFDGMLTIVPTITFQWTPGAGASPGGYNLALDGSAITTTLTELSTVLPGGIHTWTVRAYNTAGRSAWAVTRTLQVTVELRQNHLYLPLVGKQFAP